MKILALATGLLLLVIGSGLWRHETGSPVAFDGYLWLQMLDSTSPVTPESVSVARDGDLELPR